MSARFRRMAARLWPDSLFGRLALILFSGLVAAHVLAFALIVLDRYRHRRRTGKQICCQGYRASGRYPRLPQA